MYLVGDLRQWASVNFEELYCAKHSCDRVAFRRAMFWKCLYPHAIPLAVLLRGPRGNFFASDIELIAGVGAVRTLTALREEIADFHYVPENSRWLRRYARIRISTTRVRQVASAYLK